MNFTVFGDHYSMGKPDRNAVAKLQLPYFFVCLTQFVEAVWDVRIAKGVIQRHSHYSERPPIMLLSEDDFCPPFNLSTMPLENLP